MHFSICYIIEKLRNILCFVAQGKFVFIVIIAFLTIHESQHVINSYAKYHEDINVKSYLKLKRPTVKP